MNTRLVQQLSREPAGAVPGRNPPDEEVAREAVEVIEVAKARLDHSEQMLAIAGKKALRLSSIEGGKLLRQLSPRLGLVIVRVGDEMDLDTPLVAAHCDHAPALNVRGACEKARFDHDSIVVRSKNHRLDRLVGGSGPARFEQATGAHSERT